MVLPNPPLTANSGFRQAGSDAAADHVPRARAHVLAQVQRLSQQRIAGHRPVRLPQPLEGQRRRQPPSVARRNRLGDLRPVEVRAPDLRRDQEPLRRLPEQQDRPVRQAPVVQQVPMLQQFAGEASPPAAETDERGGRLLDELRHPLRVEVIRRRPDARRGLELRQRTSSLLYRYSTSAAHSRPHRPWPSATASFRKPVMRSRFAVKLENCFSHTSLKRASTLRLIDS